MKINYIILIFVVAFGILAGIGYALFFKEKVDFGKQQQQHQPEINQINNSVKLIDFYKINSEFLFSAQLAKEFEAEYVPNLKAINIYNPSLVGSNNIEKSQFYISFFKANKFLTLTTVNITKQDKIIIGGRESILYEITKKDGVLNFANQPNWRNFKHQALDIRLTKESPSYFYSFAYNPDLSEEIFNNFIGSLVFTK